MIDATNQSGTSQSYALPTHVDTRDIRFKIDGMEYEWIGGFGAIIKSRERGVKAGDVRMIAGVLFHVYMVHQWSGRWWQKKDVCWSIPSPFLSPEWIRTFKSVVLGA